MFKLCAPLRYPPWIQTGVTDRKCPYRGNFFHICDHNLLPETLTFSMETTFVNGNYFWKFHDDTFTGILWKNGNKQTDRTIHGTAWSQLTKKRNKINQLAYYNRIWPWSPIPCDDYDPRASVHYSDVIMSAMASHITGFSIVCSTVCSGADQRKYEIRRHWPLWGESTDEKVNSPQKGPVTWKCFHLMTSSWTTNTSASGLGVFLPWSMFLTQHVRSWLNPTKVSNTWRGSLWGWTE